MNLDEKEQKDGYDTPWKEILESCFQDFLAFFLPQAHEGIDWSLGYEFLDKELARITRDAEIGDRRMDKLVKVWRLDGDEQWILIHVEIQGTREANFSDRMFTYYYRAYDLHQRPVVGLAILTDDEPGWRPGTFTQELWGTRVLYHFATVKLLDYLDRSSELETLLNPFAIVTLSHLHARRTRGQPDARFRAKWQIMRSLYERGFDRQRVIDLFRFIDWVLHLSKEYDQRFWNELSHLEEIQNMPYLSSVERIGLEKGWQKGHQEGLMAGHQEGLMAGHQKGLMVGRQEGEAELLLHLLHVRYRVVPDWIREKVAQADGASLLRWSERIFEEEEIEAIFQ
ncbi:MAG: cytosolic protein [Magnetococcales bacterium]|nr:cytosolic protein [Magnetococcales bacterium]